MDLEPRVQMAMENFVVKNIRFVAMFIRLQEGELRSGECSSGGLNVRRVSLGLAKRGKSSQANSRVMDQYPTLKPFWCSSMSDDLVLPHSHLLVHTFDDCNEENHAYLEWNHHKT